MMGASDPESLHRLFAERTGASDLEGLMSLYEDGACFVGPDGVSATGTEAIRERLRGLIGLGPQIASLGSDAVVAGDIALIWSRWRLALDDVGAPQATGWDGMSIEVARRQADGSWRYVIDAPSLNGVKSPPTDVPTR